MFILFRFELGSLIMRILLDDDGLFVIHLQRRDFGKRFPNQLVFLVIFFVTYFSKTLIISIILLLFLIFIKAHYII